MDAVGHLLETWGYALLVLVGFVEFIGLPIATGSSQSFDG